jgi:hypothetical protein
VVSELQVFGRSQLFAKRIKMTVTPAAFVLLFTLSAFAVVAMIGPSIPVAHASGPTFSPQQTKVCPFTAATTSGACAFGSNTLLNDLITFDVMWQSAAAVSNPYVASDTQSLTWSLVADTFAAGTPRVLAYTGVTKSASAESVTFDWTGSATGEVIETEWTGLGTVGTWQVGTENQGGTSGNNVMWATATSVTSVTLQSGGYSAGVQNEVFYVATALTSASPTCSHGTITTEPSGSQNLVLQNGNSNGGCDEYATNLGGITVNGGSSPTMNFGSSATVASIGFAFGYAVIKNVKFNYLLPGTSVSVNTFQVTAGDTIVASFTNGNAAGTPSISDTVNTYTKIVSETSTGIAYIWTATAATTASLTVTVSGFSSGDCLLVVTALGGFEAGPTGTGTGSGTSASTTSTSYAGIGTLLVGATAYGATAPSAGTGFFSVGGVITGGLTELSAGAPTSGSSTFPATSSSTTWEDVGVAFQVPVTEVLTLSPDSLGSHSISGANYFTVTYTLGGVGGQTVHAAGTTTTFMLDTGTTYTISATSSGSGSGEEWCLSMSSSCQTTTSASVSGVSDAQTFYYYDLLQQIPSYYLVSGSGATAPTLTYKTAPSSASSSDAPATDTPTLAGTPTVVDALRGSTASVTQPIMGGGNTWNTPTSSWTISASGTIPNSLPYYLAVTLTLSYAISGGGAPTAPTLNYYSGGAPATTPLTTSPTGYTVDGGSAWSVTPNPLTGSGGTERWDTSQTTAFSSAATATIVFTYYNQYALIYSYILNGAGSFNAPTLSCTEWGSPAVDTLTFAATTYWCDNGQTWTATNPLTGSSASAVERAESTQTTTGTLSGTATTVFAFWHQYQDAFLWTSNCSPTCTGNPNLSYRQYGAVASTALSTSSQLFWFDAGSAWSVPNPWFTNLHDFSPSTAGGFVNGGGLTTQDVVYGAQSSTCTSHNPFTLFQQNCAAGTIYYAWFAVLGPYFLAFVAFLAALATYLRTENPGMATVVYEIISLVFIGLIPTVVIPIGPLMLAALIAGSLLQVVRSGKGG